MLIAESNQYKYAGKGPLDAKALIKTYAELLLPETWQVESDGKVVNGAYNGLITAVWLNKEDPTKNGIYFLYDASVTSVLKTPDVTKEANWHRLDAQDDFADIAEQIHALEEILNGNEASGADGLISKVEGLANTVSANTDKIAALIAPKSSAEIAVADDGTLSINEMNVNKLVQTKGDILILSGGGSENITVS